MRIVVAPSGFKESLGAEAAADAIAEGVLRVVPFAEIDRVPLVDGGEGSAAALAGSTGGRVIDTVVTGPVGLPVRSHFAILGDGSTAVVEMAAAAGLRLVPADRRDPGRTTSRGVGELMIAALDSGCSSVLVGCGDSGVSDGGAGALQALGARVLDRAGQEIGPGGAELARARHVDVSGLDPRLAHTGLRLAVNPHNVLCGPRGVARVFGPQKGATPEQVERLSAALDNWADVLRHDLGADVALVPGSGASGGLGAGLCAALDARLLPRFEVLLDHVDLDARLAAADLVVTAEGTIDAQTPHGKVPAEVARRAKAHGKPVVALAGRIGMDADTTYAVGIDAFQAIQPGPVALDEAILRGAEFLTDAAERMLRIVLVGTRLSTPVM
ncbi:glycerate kinase [Amycolatopsis roodepoortensis]|uniref:glycerate kinase family protein n=1 Tax=Amycolatopsis roodepoortensis TaxID=700274 RepID=UPI00214AF5D5|nr:glycerate kinase [Amycolatopsis roodepoortensis]UUV34642.1 glycerate kinase [Amycolatopsis roodepoortensis]